MIALRRNYSIQPAGQDVCPLTVTLARIHAHKLITLSLVQAPAALRALHRVWCNVDMAEHHAVLAEYGFEDNPDTRPRD